MLAKCKLNIIEIWKRIDGFDKYMISNKGRVKKLSYTIRRKDGKEVFYKEKFVKPRYKDSYYKDATIVRLESNDGKLYNLLVGVLVGDTFLPKKDGCTRIEFIDKDRTNVSLNNLVRVEDLTRKVICTTTGDIFKSMTEAISSYDLTFKNIDLEIAKIQMSKCCKGEIESFGNIYANGEKIPLKWKYF